jgi:hypothetical protein
VELYGTEWPASGKAVLTLELYEDGEILIRMNSYQILKEDPVLWVNSCHDNSLLMGSSVTN